MGQPLTGGQLAGADRIEQRAVELIDEVGGGLRAAQADGHCGSQERFVRILYTE
jgi:hypothetical protein